MRRVVALGLGLLAGACATLADTGGGDQNLPNARVGPFREIAQEELGNTRVAPYALRDDDDFPRDASVLDVDGDPSTLGSWGYFARTVPDPAVDPDPEAPPTAIQRYVALDGRSFDRDPVTVLEPSEAWEGGTVGAPSAVRVGDEVWLYYGGAEGIGLAVSADGESFTRVGDGLVLAVDGVWEQSPPRNPGVIRLPDRSFQLFYDADTDAGPAIGEARSADGVTWTRVGDGPVIAPEASVDAAGAEAPWPLVAESAEGRSIEYLYYGAVDAEGRATVAIAAREGATGAFQRGTGAVFGASGSLGPTQPCVVRYPEFTLLFATQLAGTTSAQQYPAVAIGVAPATIELPAPDPP
ncbi:MAG: hypothetical protein RIF41_10115 [Polyangiaceae bacterium]